MRCLYDSLDPSDALTLTALIAKQESVTANAQVQRASAPRLSPSRAERAFARWARSNHLKRCPGCNAIIEKRGGCNHMSCGACHHSFSWDSVPLAYPCCGYHLEWCSGGVFMRPCKHLPTALFTPMKRIQYVMQAVPMVMISAMLMVPTAPVLGLRCVLTRAVEHHRARRLASARRDNLRTAMARAQQEMEEERVRRTECRQTGEHSWVAGWCHQCGALKARVGDVGQRQAPLALGA